MSLILEQRYKDDPALSTQLVKLVSTNMPIESVKKLVEQTEEFEVSIVELKKAAASVRKVGEIVGNKHDKLSNEVNDTKERLTKVEQKK